MNKLNSQIVLATIKQNNFILLFLKTEVVKVAGAITPVPGGVGPMTVAMLMHNTFLAAQRIRDGESRMQ